MADQPTPYVSFDIAEEAAPRDDNGIVIAVMLIGALIAVPALLGLLGSISLSFGGGASAGSAVGGMFDLAYVALGVGA